MKQTESATHSQIVFSNYNYAYSYFSKKYRDSLFSLAETTNIREINKAICTFIYEFSFSIDLRDDWLWYQQRLNELNSAFREDSKFLKIMEKESMSKEEQMEALPKYYEYFLQYMDLFSAFVRELTAMFLPYSTLQERRVAFKNDNPFYERYYEIKEQVYEQLRSFRMPHFNQTFNLFVIYYHAYRIFVTKEATEYIDRKLSAMISLYLSQNCLNLILSKESLNTREMERFLRYEWSIYRSLQECNSILNECFSEQNLNIKKQERIYIDKTGI